MEDEHRSNAPPETVQDNVDQDAEASDPELEELLNVSLNEFGKHAPKDSRQSSNLPPAPTSSTSKPASENSTQTERSLPSGEGDLEDMFSVDFLAEMESQLGEAMKVMSDENPELWQQFNTFTKSLGVENLAGPAPPTSGTTTKGESSVDSCAETVGGARKEAEKGDGARKGQEESNHVDHILEDTLKKLQQNTAKGSESGEGGLEGLGDMLNQLDLGSEDSEDQFMKMMQGMMSTLLSKDVLYPSLVELRKQYPDWLEKNCNSIPEADLHRYKKQLQIMTAICDEFEKPGRADQEQSGSERILQLMQELQKHGQPPADLTSDTHAGMQGLPGMPPGFPGMPSAGPDGMDPQNCSIM